MLEDCTASQACKSAAYADWFPRDFDLDTNDLRTSEVVLVTTSLT